MSTTSAETPAHEGVSFDAELPIAWKPLDTLPALDELGQMDALNEELLCALLVLDEPVAEAEEEGQGEHWRRLDAKLDLVLGLLAEVLSRQGHLPRSRHLRLAGDWLSIDGLSAAERPAADRPLRLQLYLSPRIPRPLNLVARVSETDASEPVRLRFIGSSEATRDLLHRYVFRQHRRAVALARSLSSS